MCGACIASDPAIVVGELERARSAERGSAELRGKEGTQHSTYVVLSDVLGLPLSLTLSVFLSFRPLRAPGGDGESTLETRREGLPARDG